ncbi:PAS domain S-box protein [uncultured Cohaesibacter sp.]|uniref:two-component system sensor histidine kinase NtrB n=1 Tax=uncultured Cohaesibacter sp. TaxID=1002546 RepID=UPI0029C7C43C|nr:PAS domain S-box protein [uncultured Cohaesibacter sp.]
MDGTLTINGPKHKDGLTAEREEKAFHPLEHVDARLISLLDMAADSICLMDDHSRILLFNKTSEMLFGYTAEEVIGKRVDILMPQKYAKHHDAWVGRYLETGEHSIIGIGREVQGRHKDGSTFPFDLSVGVAETENGKQFIGVMRDLRSRKEDEQRLRSLQTELNQMTRINAMDEMGATVAHELNQPLTAIILYLQAVERKVSRLAGAGLVDQEDVEQLSDLCGRAIQEAQRSSSLLQRIRSIIEKKEPERTESDLVQIIRKAHKLSLVGFAATDVYIDLITPDDLPLVAVDPVQIEQIFLNLLRNAFQAMREVEHKAITVTLKRITDEQDRRDRLLVRFQDSGPGIPESHRKNLFKAFDAERRNGMGLGLAIARSIAQSHGGSLDLAPYDEAQPGACFLLTLPIASSPSGAEKILTAEQSDPEDGNEKGSEPAQ